MFFQSAPISRYCTKVTRIHHPWPAPTHKKFQITCRADLQSGKTKSWALDFRVLKQKTTFSAWCKQVLRLDGAAREANCIKPQTTAQCEAFASHVAHDPIQMGSNRAWHGRVNLLKKNRRPAPKTFCSNRTQNLPSHFAKFSQSAFFSSVVTKHLRQTMPPSQGASCMVQRNFPACGCTRTSKSSLGSAALQIWFPEPNIHRQKTAFHVSILGHLNKRCHAPRPKCTFICLMQSLGLHNEFVSKKTLIC